MVGGISLPRVVLVVFLVIVLGLSTSYFGQSQTGTQGAGQPDVTITDLSFELFGSSTNNIVVGITIRNIGTKDAVGGTGNVIIQTPNGTQLDAVPFSFSSALTGGSTRSLITPSLANQPDGPYQVTATITTAAEDANTQNNTYTESFTFIRSPQLRPVQINFSPPFFNLTFVSQIQVQALVDNVGLQPPVNTSTVGVEFALCRVQTQEETCDSASFTTFATQTLDTRTADLLPSNAIFSAGAEIRRREWLVPTCLSLLASAATADCPAVNNSNLEPGVYIVRVRVDADNLIAEADENDNVEFARFTVPGGDIGFPILDFVVGVNGAEARGMMFYTPDGSTLVGLDKRELERVSTCLQVVFATCPYDTQRIALMKAFTTVSLNANSEGSGTVKVNVFDPDFQSYNDLFKDQSTGMLVLLQEDFRPARITKMAQNRTRQILYVGLSNGNLITYNFANPANLSDPTKLQSVKRTFVLGGEIAALQVIGNGVYVGTNEPNSSDPTAQGRVYFIQDKNSSNNPVLRDQRIPLGHRVQKIVMSPSATTVFVATEQSNSPTQPKLVLWWASNQVQSGQLTGFLSTLQQVQLGNGFVGESWDDLVVNQRQRAYLSVTNSNGVSQLYGYNFQRGTSGGQEVLNVTPLFGPLTTLRDNCDAREVAIGQVQAMALGDDTPEASGDQVLHIAAAETSRVLTLQIQKRNATTSRIEDVVNGNDLLKWRVTVDGVPTSIKVDDAGQGKGRNPDGSAVVPNGLILVPSDNNTVYLIDGNNRAPCSPDLYNAALQTDSGVVAPLDTSETLDQDFFGRSLPGVSAFYAADAIYFWKSLLQDIPDSAAP